ncbi:MAG: TPM domain-containing protein [Clostridiales bacterium]|nr:TPM domain-containing protein [Clostridiales bacterium]
MNRLYRNVVTGLLIAALALGGLGLFLQYGVFQGILASKTERTNTECLTDERVFDNADVLTDSEEERLRNLIAKKEKVIGADIVLVTIRDSSINDYYSIREYAQNYYEENLFGWNEANGDGVIYVDNWATGYCWMCTTGRAAEKLDDNTIQYIIDRTNDIVNSYPFRAYRTMVRETASEMQNLNLFHFHVKNIWLLLVALVITVAVVVINLMNNKGETTTNRSTYVPEGGVKMNERQDFFLRSHVHRVRIERDHGSGGGHGGGGAIGGTGGHGGGGGRH